MNLKPLAIAIAASLPLLAAAEGLTWSSDVSPWPQLRARIGLSMSPALPGDAASRLQSLQLIGDYYFFEQKAPRGSAPSGLRATSGLLFGGTSGGLALPGSGGGMLSASRAAYGAAMPEAGDAWSTASPYLGLGYSATFLRSQWALSADIGLVSRGPDVRLGRPYTGGQNLDAHDPQFSPVIQFGVSYSF